ncbi:MAG: alpha/beta hydrolase, partial [Acidobacteriota bacterium]
PADINIPPLKEALQSAGNSDFTVKTLPGANHLFQKAVTGSPSEYAQLKKEFINGFLEELSNWILPRVK